ncbi:uncharacterized protein LOC111302176 [Durio zibethinus]|uniref:Uncharacterized protein LOC111302176 n=1 Tax=Durio zibethinus TaxID=66656 RepID=A0A6P5ZLR3_DURZI|nr:uncharacterized protein LOC111302176 [Durio zibethinus]
MASTCISNCVNDTRVPVRPTYMNLYKWPESDAEFVRSLSSDGSSRGSRTHPSVVDSISCRQMYLRSYTFHRKETEPEKTKCFGRGKNEKAGKSPRRKNKSKTNPKKNCVVLRTVWRRLLTCTTKVDVADHGD